MTKLITRGGTRGNTAKRRDTELRESTDIMGWESME